METVIERHKREYVEIYQKLEEILTTLYLIEQHESLESSTLLDRYTNAVIERCSSTIVESLRAEIARRMRPARRCESGLHAFLVKHHPHEFCTTCGYPLDDSL